MRWIVDTSAWSRKHLPAVADQIEALLVTEEDELVLSPGVELELLRAPQNDEVAEERVRLEDAMSILEADARTFKLAADAMVTLAEYEATAHRRPVVDLITAALAHQHECGIVHLDGDYELLAAHSGLSFPLARLELRDDDGGGGGGAHIARRQRELKNELAQVIHQMPIDEAEAFLEDAIKRARERVQRKN